MSQPAPDRRSELVRFVLAFARVLHVNGESTDDTVSAAGRLLERVVPDAQILPGWEEIQIESAQGSLGEAADAAPTGVNMERVTAALQLSEKLSAGAVGPSAALQSLRVISRAPPAPTWLFTLA